MEFIDSNSDLRRSWFVSLANKKDGEDIELNNCIIFEQVGPLKPSRYPAMLLITARRAG
jgi:hypothetical protein